jgi:hypothetical protein
MKAKDAIRQLEARYDGLWQKLEDIVTTDNYFEIFKKLSDNYSPTLTVSRVQGPLVKSLLAGRVGRESPVSVHASLRQSGTIGVVIGEEPAPVWLSGHADICSYLTGVWDGNRYALTPFCMHRADPGRRAAVALAAPDGQGPLTHLAQGEMVTDEQGRVFFETDSHDLPLWTRVVHHLPATWQQESDKIHGFIDNQGTCAALLLAARVLSHYKVNALLLLNDEEEGPVDKGNQGFSRALTRLLNRTPHDWLPQTVFVSDVHQQESLIKAGQPTLFGQGALYGGMASGARGAVTPPQLVAFTRDLSAELASRGIRLTENHGYISRSDDISAMQYTQNVNLIGFAGIHPHFDRTPTSLCSDVVHLTKTLVIYALIAQDPAWRQATL